MALEPRAKFRITADGSDYKRKLKAALRDTNSFAGSVASALKTSAIAGGAGFAAAAVAVRSLAAEAAKSVDILAKQSDILGISTQKMAAYQLAARLSGSSNEGFEKGLRKVQKAIVDAENGLTTYTRAFESLRLDPAKLKELAPDEQFNALAKAFSNVENQTDRVAIAYDLFGGKNTALLNTLLLTGKSLNQIEEDTKAWGVAISRVDAKQIENANDAMERARTATQGIGTNLALALAPLREDVANAFADSAAEAQGFKSEIQATMEALVVGANFAMNAIRGIELAFLGTKLATQQLRLEAEEEESFIGSTLAKAHRLMVFRTTGTVDGSSSKDRSSEILRELDETGAAIDALIGKFRSGDQALDEFRSAQAAAVARARKDIEPQTAAAASAGEDDQTPFEIFGDKERDQLAQRLEAIQRSLLTETEALRLAHEERALIVQEAFERGLINQEEQTLVLQELKAHHDNQELQRAQDKADKLAAIEQRRLKQQQSLEQRHLEVVNALRARSMQSAIGLLRNIGAQSKAAARASILIEQAAAVRKIIIHSNVAAARALAELGPIKGAVAAAQIKAWGAALAAATAVQGALALSDLGSGSAGSGLSGVPVIQSTDNPVFSDDSSDYQFGQPPGRVINITINGNALMAQDQLVGILKEIVDSDQVFIESNSRQAAEIRRS